MGAYFRSPGVKMAKMVELLLSERVLVTYNALLFTSVSLKNSLGCEL